VTYIVNEVFHTIQGEGHWTGRAAVFCRFSRCNLWSGKEEDRSTAICQFCDTDFLNGTKMSEDELVDTIFAAWPVGAHKPMVVFTGGEPLLQLDEQLIGRVKDLGFYVAVETNGTRQIPRGIDWLCVSPKAGADLAVNTADELKLVFPQRNLMPHDLTGFQANLKWISPMDASDYEENLSLAISYVMLVDPVWRLNVQIHKTIGVR